MIPAKNGAATLETCLRGIRQQSLYPRCDIVVIDSGSTDGTVEFLKKQPDVRLYQISPESFNHGLTRNYGVSLARGVYVVMTVQDAEPADGYWLEKMLRHFEDFQVAGVCGQQIVPHHSDKNPHQWFRPIHGPKVQRFQFSCEDEFEKLSAAEKKDACSWDDVNAMYRREVLVRIPFRDAFFSEDAMWAKDALLAGYTLVYDTSARINHYHFQTYDYAYKRMLTQLYFGYKIFGHRRVNSFHPSEYFKMIYRNFRYKVHPKWIWHNYQMLRARNRAFNDFYNNLAKGELRLDIFYTKVCDVPPQGNIK